MSNSELMDKTEARYLLLYLLNNFNQICEKWNIPSYASGGTCLGAVRHQGFIPWDDDIDVMIPREYYDRFVEACKTELPDIIIARSRENDPLFCCEYIKLCYPDDELGYSDLSLDVFFLDETNPERKVFRSIQNRVLIDLYYIKLYKTSRMQEGSPYIPKNPLKRVVMAIEALLPIPVIDRIHKWTMTAEKAKGPYWVNWGSCYSYKKATYSKEALGTPQKLKFENTFVFAAQHPETILTQLYGANYMTPPPPEKRTDHGVRKLTCTELDMEKIKQEVNNEEQL